MASVSLLKTTRGQFGFELSQPHRAPVAEAAAAKVDLLLRQQVAVLKRLEPGRYSMASIASLGPACGSVERDGLRKRSKGRFIAGRIDCSRGRLAQQ